MARKAVLSHDANGECIHAVFHPLTTVSLTIGAASIRNSKPLNTGIVRLLATSDCHIVFGNSTVVATSNDMPLLKNLAEYFVLQPNDYIAVIQDSGAGTLFITIMEGTGA